MSIYLNLCQHAGIHLVGLQNMWFSKKEYIGRILDMYTHRTYLLITNGSISITCDSLGILERGVGCVQSECYVVEEPVARLGSVQQTPAGATEPVAGARLVMHLGLMNSSCEIRTNYLLLVSLLF